MELPNLRSQPFFDDKARAFWMLQSLGWSFYLMLRLASGVGAGLSIKFAIPVLVSAATGYSMTLVMGGIYRWLINRRPVITWSLSVVAFGVAVIIHSGVDSWVFNLVNGSESQTGGAFLLRAIPFITLNSLLLGAWSALYYGINFYLIVEDQADQLVRLEGQASSAQLAMLRYQLNPHFLFNTLNSISTLVLLKQTERANAMLSRLSSFLRYTLANEPTAQVTLEQEIETLKLYLEIEKMRFEERLRTHFDIDPATSKTRLPSLLLQPLVENAIKYAVTPQEEGADIAVEARLAGDRVQITVSDTGGGLSESANSASDSTGVGLANIRDRLSQAYADDHRFEVRSPAGGGFSVMIDIPYQTEVPQLEAV
jgi:two-component system, LytTR family, sensor kinase